MTHFPTMIEPVADPAPETPAASPATEVSAVDTAALKFDMCRWQAPAGSKPTRGAPTAASSKSAAALGSRLLLGKFFRERNPLPRGRETLILAPVRSCVLRAAQLLERDREVKLRVRVDGVQPDGVVVADLRFAIPAEIVVHVSEVEVRLEA